MSNLLNGKIAMITGSNRGIGQQLVELFARNGADIVAHARKPSNEYELFLNGISQQYNVEVHPVYFDLVDYDSMKKEMKKILSELKRIDILVNNAGVAVGGLFQMTSVKKIRDIFDINFFAALELTQVVLRYMVRNRNGVIINMASVAGIDLNAGNIAYGTSKAALIAATKTLANELGSIGIRVNAVAPGLTDTDMASLMDPDAEREMIRSSAIGRKATVSEISEVILFLASDKASFINGQVIRVDGSMH